MENTQVNGRSTDILLLKEIGFSTAVKLVRWNNSGVTINNVFVTNLMVDIAYEETRGATILRMNKSMQHQGKK